jgi:hypothetical protein
MVLQNDTLKLRLPQETVVDVSRTEWKAAKKFGKHYYLVRVINVRDFPKIFFIKDPIELERRGKVVKTAAGWRIELGAAMRVE